MSDPSAGPTKGELRAQRIRDYRARNAEATDRYQGQFSRYLSWLLIGLGVLMALGSAVNQVWWSVGGGVVVAVGGVLIRVADRHRVETIEPGDRPAHRSELGWYLLAVLCVVAGLVLAAHPW